MTGSRVPLDPNAVLRDVGVELAYASHAQSQGQMKVQIDYCRELIDKALKAAALPVPAATPDDDEPMVFIHEGDDCASPVVKTLRWGDSVTIHAGDAHCYVRFDEASATNTKPSPVPAATERPDVDAIIERLRRERVFEPYPEATHLVRLDDAEAAVREAVAAARAEIVAMLRSGEATEVAAMTWEPDSFIGDAPHADEALADAARSLAAVADLVERSGGGEQ